jgi:heavy metal-binding protein
MMKMLALAALSLLVVGCADTQPMTLGTDHPGNAAAPEAPSPEPSRTLAVTEPVLAPSQAATAPGGHDHHHDDVGGMNMSAAPDTVSTAARTQPTTQQATYTCPMHPKVVSDNPGKCPKCGMTLVKKGGG